MKYFLNYMCFIFFLCLLPSCGKRNIDELKKHVEIYKNLIAFLHGAQLYSYSMEGEKLNSDLKFLDMEGDTLDINELFTTKNKLIVYFKSNMCSSCIETELKRIEEAFTTQFISNNVICLLKCNSLSEFKAYYSSRFDDMNIKLCLNELFCENYNIETPLVFVTNNHLTIRMVYFPDKALELSGYYALAKDKYFNL